MVRYRFCCSSLARSPVKSTFWSTTHQPTQWKPDQYEAIFTEGRAEFRRRDQGIDLIDFVPGSLDRLRLRRDGLLTAGGQQPDRQGQ